MGNHRILSNKEVGIFAKVLLSFSTVDYADQFFTDTFTADISYEDKYEILKKYFVFHMTGGYVPENQPHAEKVRVDYLYTLQHLINKAKVVGIRGVIKSEYLQNYIIYSPI